VGENVYGLVNWNGGLVFDTVCIDLENEGFQVIPVVLPAASVNAPHKRDRIFFIAYSGACEHRGKSTEIHGKTKETDGCRDEQSPSPWKQIQLPFEPSDLFQTVENPLRGRRTHREYEQKGTEVWEQWNIGPRSTNWLYISERIASNSNNARTDIPMRIERESEKTDNKWKGQSFIKHWKNGRNGLDTNFKVFTKPGDWSTFPTQPPLCQRNDGIPPKLDGITFSKWRNESIKGYGNAVVPQVVHQIFKAIQQYEDDRK
jgi:DNA (cytosine-5)-methyltransferase 1